MTDVRQVTPVQLFHHLRHSRELLGVTLPMVTSRRVRKIVTGMPGLPGLCNESVLDNKQKGHGSEAAPSAWLLRRRQAAASKASVMAGVSLYELRGSENTQACNN